MLLHVLIDIFACLRVPYDGGMIPPYLLLRKEMIFLLSCHSLKSHLSFFFSTYKIVASSSIFYMESMNRNSSHPMTSSSNKMGSPHSSGYSYSLNK